MHFRGHSDIGIKKKIFRDSAVRTKKSEEKAMNLQRTMSEQKLFWEKGLTSAADCCKIRSTKELLLCRFRYYNPRLSWILKHVFLFLHFICPPNYNPRLSWILKRIRFERLPQRRHYNSRLSWILKLHKSFSIVLSSSL